MGVVNVQKTKVKQELRSDVKERLDAFVESSKDINLLGLLLRRPRLIKKFHKLYAGLCDDCQDYVGDCTRRQEKIDFKRFCPECAEYSLPILECILHKLNK